MPRSHAHGGSFRAPAMIPYEALQAIIHAEAGNLEAGMHDRAQNDCRSLGINMQDASWHVEHPDMSSSSGL